MTRILANENILPVRSEYSAEAQVAIPVVREELELPESQATWVRAESLHYSAGRVLTPGASPPRPFQRHVAGIYAASRKQGRSLPSNCP